MAKSTFVYVTYIATQAETLWKALLDGEFTRQYWGHENVSDWKPGSPWRHQRADAAHTVVLLGEVLEADAPRRLVITWGVPPDRAGKDGPSRVTFQIEPVADMVRLTVTHDELKAGSEMQRKITHGWPRVLSSLKSLLETGRALQTWAES
ncbi:MAG: SRPBCC family protein [Thiobacillaceae bacterium]